MNARSGHLLVSLHDVAPSQMERVGRAEALFAEVGLAKATYLLVPNFHGEGHADLRPDFGEWIAQKRSFEIRWFLHGYYHEEIEDESLGIFRHPWEWLKRRVLSAGEAEFAALESSILGSRLGRAQRIFLSCLGTTADGFVAPAWLFRDELLTALARGGFRITENHTRIFDVQAGTSLPSPLVTWAVGRPWMKYASLLTAPLMALAGGGFPLMRVCLHPQDFDHPETVAEIRFLLKELLRRRQASFYEEAMGLRPLRVLKKIS